jgi:nucleoid-associated protein YgaU
LFTQEQAARLKNDNLALHKLLNDLRAQKSVAPATQSSAKGNEAMQKPIPPGTRTHVVKSGETMASIAQKYYKSKARWKDIQDANFYSTGGTPKIKVGQTLIIP